MGQASWFTEDATAVSFSVDGQAVTADAGQPISTDSGSIGQIPCDEEQHSVTLTATNDEGSSHRTVSVEGPKGIDPEGVVDSGLAARACGGPPMQLTSTRTQEPTQAEVLDAARRVAQARLAVRHLPPHRHPQRSWWRVDRVERAHEVVVALQAEVRVGGTDPSLRRRLARAKLTERLVARGAGFGSFDDYRRVCRPRTSLTATAYARLRAHRELAHAELAWDRVRSSLLGAGEAVVDLTGDVARLSPGRPVRAGSSRRS